MAHEVLHYCHRYKLTMSHKKFPQRSDSSLLLFLLVTLNNLQDCHMAFWKPAYLSMTNISFATGPRMNHMWNDKIRKNRTNNHHLYFPTSHSLGHRLIDLYYPCENVLYNHNRRYLMACRLCNLLGHTEDGIAFPRHNFRLFLCCRLSVIYSCHSLQQPCRDRDNFWIYVLRRCM